MHADTAARKVQAPGSLAMGRGASQVALAFLGLAPALITLLATLTDLDLRLADAVFDVRLQAFPWRHAWLAEQFSHVLLKRVLIGLAVIMIVMAMWDLVRPLPWSHIRRVQVRIVAMSAALTPLIISALKQVSSSHCPWDIDRYGGTAPYIRLFDALPAGVEAGHCLPGGHASSALWLISAAVFFLPARPRLAVTTFALMLALGMAVGWLQQMRGAHFFTHTLWSAWIACSVHFILVQRT